MVTTDDIKNLLQDHLQATELTVADIGGCGSSFEVRVVSAQFEGKRLLERQRLVNAALAGVMPEIHALTMKCLTPAQAAEQAAAGS